MYEIVLFEDSHLETIILYHPKRLKVHDKRPENCKEEFEILRVHFGNR
jgi:hypothetical protein